MLKRTYKRELAVQEELDEQLPNHQDEKVEFDPVFLIRFSTVVSGFKLDSPQTFLYYAPFFLRTTFFSILIAVLDFDSIYQCLFFFSANLLVLKERTRGLTGCLVFLPPGALLAVQVAADEPVRDVQRVLLVRRFDPGVAHREHELRRDAQGQGALLQ